jgi:uncharacterized protein (TIGR03083 family)
VTDALTPDDHLGALWRDGLAMGLAAHTIGLDAPVPSCPGWDVGELLWHTGEVHWFWRTAVAERWQDPSSYVEPGRPGDDQLVAWFKNGVQDLVEVLRSADPGEPVWTWAPRGGTVAWVARRMAQETAVHRWDADSAGGDPQPIEATLAVDGIDELFDHFSDAAAKGAAPVDGTVHLHCTDVDGEWLVSEPEVGGRLVVSREHAKGDAAVRATASDLLLALWRRAHLDDDSRFEVFGDRSVAQRLLARASLD